MYNHLSKYLTDKKILHPQQFGFRKGHSTEHAIAQLVDQIYESFENDNYGITCANLVWFGSYPANRKQYFCIYQPLVTTYESLVTNYFPFVTHYQLLVYKKSLLTPYPPPVILANTAFFLFFFGVGEGIVCWMIHGVMDFLNSPWCRSGVFIVNFEHISHLFLVFPWLTLIL